MGNAISNAYTWKHYMVYQNHWPLPSIGKINKNSLPLRVSDRNGNHSPPNRRIANIM